MQKDFCDCIPFLCYTASQHAWSINIAQLECRNRWRRKLCVTWVGSCVTWVGIRHISPLSSENLYQQIKHRTTPRTRYASTNLQHLSSVSPLICRPPSHYAHPLQDPSHSAPSPRPPRHCERRPPLQCAAVWYWERAIQLLIKTRL